MSLQIILLAVQTVLLVLLAYLLLLTAAAVWQARQPSSTSAVPRTPFYRFLILISAHNEEQLLPRLLASLARLDYPAALYGVHVVADNCTDQTTTLAQQMGATVHERTDTDNRGKGPALQWLLQRIRVLFAPEATVWTEMPASLAQAGTQHTRWESGRLEMARRYVPRLLKAGWQVGRRGQFRRAFVFLDAALEHLIPPLAIFAMLIAVGLFAAVAFLLLET